MRLSRIPWNLRVAKMTHRSWLTPLDHRSIIQMMCIDCSAVSDDASLLRITKHPWKLLTPLVGILLSSHWLYCWSSHVLVDRFIYCLVLVTWPVAQHIYIACGMRMDSPQTVHLSSPVQALYSPGSIRYPSSSGPSPSPPLATSACHSHLVGQFSCLALAFTQPPPVLSPTLKRVTDYASVSSPQLVGWEGCLDCPSFFLFVLLYNSFFYL